MNQSERNFANPLAEPDAVPARYFEPRDDGVDFPDSYLESSIPRRFEKIAQSFPDRIAVKMSDRSLSYEELNRAACRIAHYILQQRGQGSEPVALLLEQGVDIFPAIIGVLMAGKFYVALDPASPPARLDYIMQDAGAKLLVSNGTHRELTLGIKRQDVTLLNIDEIDTSTNWDEPRLPIASDDFAALNYTSGSEGLSKGLIESHRFILHTTRALTYLKRITSRDRLTLFHFVGFAAAEAHLLPALLNGACLCPFDIKSNGVQHLISWLDTESITLGHMPVSAFRQLAELMPAGAMLPRLRLLQLSGAPITRSDFDLYRSKFSQETSLQILMGTTESGAIASGIFDHDYGFPESGSPIGYAWPNTQIRLLDNDGSDVAPGEVGEITVRSRYMSGGYWRKEELTRAKFSQNRGSEEQTYRTGDLGRMMPDGFIVHMGRKDWQVKIRGYRVEIGEVEQVLLSHPAIKDAAVRAWDRQSGEKYLAAYVVAREQNRLGVSGLVEFMRTQLPDYMIPAGFLFLNSLPLTNGKIDRSALPPPERTRPDLGNPYVASRNESESAIVRIWEELLEISPIGIHDDFFDLGGHSLLATQAVSRVLQAFNVEIPLRLLFENPTAAALAEQIVRAQANSFSADEIAALLADLETPSMRKRGKLIFQTA